MWEQRWGFSQRQSGEKPRLQEFLSSLKAQASSLLFQGSGTVPTPSSVASSEDPFYVRVPGLA